MSKPSSNQISALLSDVEEATDNITTPLNAFAEMCSNDDGKNVLQAESRALFHLYSKFYEVSARDQAEIRKFVLQVASSVNRMKVSSPTRAALIQWSKAALLDGVRDILPLLQVKSITDPKERSLLAVEWLTVSPREEKLQLIAALIENISECGHEKQKKGGDSSLSNSVHFLTTALSLRPCDETSLALMSFFDSIINVCFEMSAIQVKRMAIKAAQCWFACGMDPSISVKILLSFATTECDASLRNSSLDAIMTLISKLEHHQLLSMLSQLCFSIDVKKFPPTVLEKYLAVLLQLSKVYPSDFPPSAGVDASLSSLPFFSELLAQWVVPACLVALQKAISCCRNILENNFKHQSSNIDDFLTYQLQASDTCGKGEGGVRLQWKILCSCIAILSDNKASTSISQLVNCYEALKVENPVTARASTKVLSTILQKVNPSTDNLIELSQRIIASSREWNKSDDGLTNSVLDTSSGLDMFIGEMAEPHTLELIHQYLTRSECCPSGEASSGDTEIDLGLDGDSTYSDVDKQRICAILYCLVSGRQGISRPSSSEVVEILSEFLNTCLSQIEDIAESFLSNDQAQGKFNIDVKLVSQLLKAVAIFLPQCSKSEFIAKRLQTSVYSPSEWSLGLLGIEELQVDLVKLSSLLPNPTQDLFEYFAAYFENALNDKWDEEIFLCSSVASTSSRSSMVELAFKCLKVICTETSRNICDVIDKKWKMKASKCDASLQLLADKQHLGDDDDDEEGSFYLDHLVIQQRLELEKSEALEGLVLGGGFMACYTALLQDFSLDEKAPCSCRASALRALGVFASCSVDLSNKWSPWFLQTAQKNHVSSQIRVACLSAWVLTEAQQPSDEVQIANLLLPLTTPIENVEDEESESGEGVLFAPVEVRLAALEVLKHLVLSDRVKGRQSLCRICEGLADSNKQVVEKTKDILKSSIVESPNGGASLLFEVAFSGDASKKRLKVVKLLFALLQSVPTTKIDFEGLSLIVAREVINKFGAIPAELLSMLPLTQRSNDILHQALLRGTLRSAGIDVLKFIKIYLNKDLVKDAPLMKSMPDKDTATTNRKSKSGSNTCLSDDYTEALTRLDSSRLMIQDLQRLSSTSGSMAVPDLSNNIEMGNYEDENDENETHVAKIVMIEGDSSPSTQVPRDIAPKSTSKETASMSEAIQLFKKQRRQKASSSSKTDRASRYVL